MSGGYKGDVLPVEAYKALQEKANSVLIDVRTTPEWAFVGVPAVERLLRIAWQEFPAMEVNADFAAEVEAAGIEKTDELYLICRSGQRSASAAAALTAAGFANCYNVSEGFEGDRNGDGHRGTLGGWKHAGLPWFQG